MGCGAGKTTKETTLNSHIPAPSASKAVRQGKIAPAGDKLPNEVLEGLERLLKRFARVEVKAKHRADAKGVKKPEAAKTAEDKKQEKQQPPAAQMRDIAVATADGTKRESAEAEETKLMKAPTLTAAPPAAFTLETAQVKPDSEAPEESAQPIGSSEPPADPVPVGESVSANPIPDALLQSEALPAEPKQAFEEDWSPRHEDQRDSPEPPRPATLSDDEAQPYEDETLRKQRLEKERLALEEAERLAAQQRAVQEEQTLAQRGKMASMQNQANDILAKYR